MSKTDVSSRCKDCYLKYMLAPTQYEQLRDALYKAIELAHKALDDGWTGSEEQLRQFIMAEIGIDEETYNEAMK